MSKPVFHRDHLDAFMSFVVEDILDPKRNAIADEQRARSLTYMTIAFYLTLDSKPITIGSIAEKTGFMPRTVNLGFKYLTEAGYLEPELTVASHGRGRAYQYSFSNKIVKKVLARAARA
jgi:predicted ArsR family transcriptional regulator